MRETDKGARSSKGPFGLTGERRLSGSEVASTAVAAVVSASLYVREGHPYLARGVVGDLAGFVLLSLPLALWRRRARHEALICLGSIAVVRALNPSWPLRQPSGFWWKSVSVGLLLYGITRWRALALSGE